MSIRIDISRDERFFHPSQRECVHWPEIPSTKLESVEIKTYERSTHKNVFENSNENSESRKTKIN